MRAGALNATLLAVAPPAYGQARPDSVWFRRQFSTLDLTGDGRSDTLVLRATGGSVDRRLVVLTIRSAGHTVYRNTWSSASYFQYDGPLDSIPEPTKHETVFRHLREVLVTSAFGPFTPGDGRGADNELPPDEMSHFLALQAAKDSLRRTGMREDSILRAAYPLAKHMKPDTAILARAWRALVHRRPRTFTYFSGGESTQTIVWSSVLGKFVTVFACC